MVLALATLLALASASDHVPPPRGHWISDETGKLSGATLQQVDVIAQRLQDASAGQLGVLVTRHVEGSSPRRYATDIFNAWGVGHAARNDGVFVFFALDDRKAEIVLGDGASIVSSQTDLVMANDIVANMKRGDLDSAVLSACRSLEQLMIATQRAFTTSGYDSPQVDDELGPYGDGTRSFPERSPRSWVVDLSNSLSASDRAKLDVAASDLYSAQQGRLFFLVYKSTAPSPDVGQLSRKLAAQVTPLASTPVSVIAVDLSGSAAIWLPADRVPGHWESRQLSQAERDLQAVAMTDPLGAMLIARKFAQQALTTGIPPRPMDQVLAEGFEQHQAPVFGAGGGLLLGGALFFRRWNRKRIRQCGTCGRPRELLSEATEDAHLSQAQQKEEELKSVDYDVWYCGQCRDVLTLRYGAWFSGYSACGGCGAKTLKSTSTTLQHATYDHGGLVQVDEKCLNCSFTRTSTRTTARLEHSSSSSSGSSSSFGGGSSSGGGSSGSW